MLAARTGAAAAAAIRPIATIFALLDAFSLFSAPYLAEPWRSELDHVDRRRGDVRRDHRRVGEVIDPRTA